MSEQPREHDKIRVTVVGEYSPDHDGDAYVLLADDVAYPILADATVEVLERAVELCRATEGATGIECGLPRRHALDVDHEGTHDPATTKYDGIGYRLTVRWPWNEWDRDASAVGFEVPLPDWERVSSAPEIIPLLCGARWDGVRSCEHEPNHDGKHGFFRSAVNGGWFEWTSSREVV